MNPGCDINHYTIVCLRNKGISEFRLFPSACRFPASFLASAAETAMPGYHKLYYGRL
jgi:hypothetical protein